MASNNDVGEGIMGGLIGVANGKILELSLTGIITIHFGSYIATIVGIFVFVFSVIMVATFVLSLKDEPSLFGVGYFIGMAFGYYMLGEIWTLILGIAIVIIIFLLTR